MADDEPGIRKTLEKILLASGYEVVLAGDGAEARRHPYDAALLDLKMPGIKGFSLLKDLLKREPSKPVVVISGHGNIRTAVEAVKIGAFDFLEKPLFKERVLVTLKNALQGSRDKAKVDILLEAGKPSSLIGSSKLMDQLRNQITKLAKTEARILIKGESGTGKELVAKALFSQSRRSKEPFVSLNCAAIPESLIESELFGYEKGAFTGAHKAKPGRLETADGGTLFLDEVGDLNIFAQAKLLRALQEGEIHRLGALHSRRIDVRVFSATHRNLEDNIKKGLFREDLYFRLNVVPLEVPPLRDHLEDIPDLVTHFVSEYSLRAESSARRFTPKALDLLQKLDWPGNIRELRNLVERSLILAPGSEVTESDLPIDKLTRGARVRRGSLNRQKDELEKELIIEALDKTSHNATRAAKLLGIDRTNLHKKMRKHSLGGRL